MQTHSISGYVYLIGSSKFGWYKIGKSRTATVRIKDIGVLLPFRIDAYAVWESSNHHELEISLHETYASFHLNGEWFSMTHKEMQSVVMEYHILGRLVYKMGDGGSFVNCQNIRVDKVKEGRSAGAMQRERIRDTITEFFSERMLTATPYQLKTIWMDLRRDGDARKASRDTIRHSCNLSLTAD